MISLSSIFSNPELYIHRPETPSITLSPIYTIRIRSINRNKELLITIIATCIVAAVRLGLRWPGHAYDYNVHTRTMSSLELLDLLEETDQVTDWYMLGVYLKMPRDTLTDIEKRLSTHGVKRCKTEMFDLWTRRTPGGLLGTNQGSAGEVWGTSAGRTSSQATLYRSCQPTESRGRS